ncbi:hypothetical protein B296_00044372, partial [Ensete ventricosum]
WTQVLLSPAQHEAAVDWCMRLVALKREASVETCTDRSGRSRCCLHPHMHVSGRLRRLETATWGDKSVRLQAQSAGDVA